MSTDETGALALYGLRVLELGHIVAGPSAGLLLADLGADVIKIQRPAEGDQTRGMDRRRHEAGYRTPAPLPRDGHQPPETATMPTAITLKWWLVTGLVSMAIGLDRLFSAYLVSSRAATWFTRILIGTFCTLGGVVFVAVAYSTETRVRRER